MGRRLRHVANHFKHACGTANYERKARPLVVPARERIRTDTKEKMNNACDSRVMEGL